MTDIVVEITENNTQVTVSAPDVIVVTDVPPATSAAASAAAAAASEAAAAAAETTASAAAVTATTQAGVSTTQAGIATTQAGIATAAAGTATTQAGLASGYATTAQGYRDEAQTAAGTATTQAGIATTQAGLASNYADAAAASAAAAAAAVASGVAGGTLPASFTTLKASEHIALAATKKLYLDGVAASGDTYITESIGNVVDHYVGANLTLRLLATGAVVTGTVAASGGAAFGHGSAPYASIYKMHTVGAAIITNTTDAVPIALGNGLHIIGGTGAGDALAPGILTLGEIKTAVAANDVIGRLRWYSNDASTSMAGIVGKIDLLAEADFTAGQAKTSLTFHTNTGVADSLAERMRISSEGNVGIGMAPVANSNYLVLDYRGRAATQALVSRFYTSDGTQTGAIQSDTNYGFLAAAVGARPFSVFTNGSERLQVNSAGTLGIAATAKLTLDGVAGTGDTYITESAANTLDIYSGGSRAIRAVGAEVSMTGALNISGLTGSAYSFNGTVNFIAGSTAGHSTITLVSSPSSAGYFAFADGTGTPDRYAGLIAYYHNTNLLELRASGTPVIGITQTTVGIPAAAKLCLDGISGAGDTYMVESSANVLDFHSGNIRALRASSGALTLGFDSSYNHVINGAVAQTTRNSVVAYDIVGVTTGWTSYKIANTSGNLYMGVASSAGVLFTGSTAYASGIGNTVAMPLEFATNSTVRAAVGASGGFALAATGKLYLDGVAAAGDTYLVESSANVLDLYAGGTKTLSLAANGAAVTGTLSTTDPAGGAGPAWKLGVAASVSPTAPNRTLRVDVAGTSYYLAAKTTND